MLSWKSYLLNGLRHYKKVARVMHCKVLFYHMNLSDEIFKFVDRFSN